MSLFKKILNFLLPCKLFLTFPLNLYHAKTFMDTIHTKHWLFASVYKYALVPAFIFPAVFCGTRAAQLQRYFHHAG